jgi:hypothetical protein
LFVVWIEAALIRSAGRLEATEASMRVLVLIRADQSSEAGVLPDEKYLAEMTKFNEELVNAGVMLGGEGLHPSSKAKRVRFSGGKVTVLDGPFAETKEVIAGYWMWKVASMEEAVDWVRRIPSPEGATEGEIEIRPIFETEEFGAELTPELREREAAIRARSEKLGQQVEG